MIEAMRRWDNGITLRLAGFGAAFGAAAVLALAGCGAGPGTSPTPGSSTTAPPTTAPPTSTPPPGSPSPGPTGSPVPAGEPLVSFSREGGLAGFQDELVIWPDGTYQRSRRGTGERRGHLPADKVARLRQLLDGAHLADLPPATGGEVADGYTYRLTYGGRTVTTHDGGIPPALDPVLGALNDILAGR